MQLVQEPRAYIGMCEAPNVSLWWASRRNWDTRWAPSSTLESNAVQIFVGTQSLLGLCRRGKKRHTFDGRTVEGNKKKINKLAAEKSYGKWDFINLWWWQRRWKRRMLDVFGEAKKSFDWYIGSYLMPIGFHIVFFVRLFLVRVRVDGSNSDGNHSHKWRRRPKSISSVVNSISKTHSENEAEKKNKLKTICKT